MKNKQEMIQYIFWGVLSTILNIGLFRAFIWAKMEYWLANALTLVVVKIFCYFTNKLFVFRTPYIDLKHLLKEMLSFFIARGFTFLIDFFGLMFMVEMMQLDAFLSKCVMIGIVFVINYVLSKKFVFH